MTHQQLNRAKELSEEGARLQTEQFEAQHSPGKFLNYLDRDQFNTVRDLVIEALQKERNRISATFAAL
jgi:hypothetical protein